MEHAVKLEGLGKRYKVYNGNADRLRQALSLGRGRHYREFWAVRDVSLDIHAGATTAIIGVNGSGKSTLLKLLCGIVRPTEGTVTARGRISTLLDLGAGFSPEFTGVENVYMNGALMGYTKARMDERLPEIAEFAGIGEFINRPVKTYSSGMRIRLAFACAITVDPDILVVDEVLAVGDAKFQQKCYAKIKDFQDSGKTIIMVSHDMNAVLRHAQQVVLLDKGTLLFQGEPRDVVNKYYSILWDSAGASRNTAGAGTGDAPAVPGYAAAQGPPPEGCAAAGGPEDRCPSRRGYNPGEHRYGRGGARVFDFEMLDEGGSEVQSVTSGEPVRFRVSIFFEEPVEKPVYGFLIRTKQGVDVYGHSTLFSDVPVKARKQGEVEVVEFTQRVPLTPGDYFLSAGVVEFNTGKEEILDRRHDLALFQIRSSERWAGVVNLGAKITLLTGNSEC